MSEPSGPYAADRGRRNTPYDGGIMTEGEGPGLPPHIVLPMIGIALALWIAAIVMAVVNQ